MGVPTTAEGWVARAQAHGLTPEEARSLEAWLSAAPANRDAFERCRRLAQLGDRLRQRADLVRAMPAYAALPGRPPRRVTWNAFALAAGAAAVLTIVLVLPRMGSEAPAGSITTAHGQQRQLALADGSSVHLNSDSSLRIAFSDTERRIALATGEAYFEVTRDAAGRPFVVVAGTTQVRVLGTKFSVLQNSSGTRVVVSEGKVEVIPDATRNAPSIPAKVELVPGNVLRFDRHEARVQIAAVDPQRATAWRSGSIDFENETLAEVIAEVNRYTRSAFVIADERLLDVRLSGTFKVGDAESVKFALKDAFGIEAVSEGGEIRLRRR